MRHTVVLGWPAELMNMNDRHHHMKKAALTKAWRTEAYRKFVDIAAEHGPYDRVRVVVHYRFADNRRREVANLQPTSKACVDGIVDAGLVLDDRDEIVLGPDNRREYPNGPPRISVTVYELTGADDAA